MNVPKAPDVPNIDLSNEETIYYLTKNLEKCTKEVEKLQKSLVALLISTGNNYMSKPVEKNEYHNARNHFNKDVLLNNYGFSPKVVSQVLSKMKQSGKLKRTPEEYSKRTGKLKG